jgi:pimeloyl-ACP methyl ester carboxylesterase
MAEMLYTLATSVRSQVMRGRVLGQGGTGIGNSRRGQRVRPVGLAWRALLIASLCLLAANTSIAAEVPRTGAAGALSNQTTNRTFTWQGVFEAAYKDPWRPTSFIRGIWDIHVEAKLEFDLTLPSGEYSRIYSVTSVLFKMPFEYSTYKYDPVTKGYSFVGEKSLLVLDSSDFNLAYNCTLDTIPTFGCSSVSDSMAGGYSSTGIFLKHDARKVFTTAKGLELSLGGGTSGSHGGFATVTITVPGNPGVDEGHWPFDAKATPPEGYAVFDGSGYCNACTVLRYFGPRGLGAGGAARIRFLDADDENRVLVGAAADGAARVIVEISGVKASADVTFPDGDGLWATEPALGPNGVWRRTWQAPPDFGSVPTGEDRTRRPVGFQISVDGVALDPPPFYLYRAPVVLLHGIWAGAEVWASLESDMETDGYFVVNYPYPKNASLETNKGVLQDHAAAVLAKAHTHKVAARKVDVVGHSMGGLVAKYDPANSDRVRRVVTVGTPHCGSPLADVFYPLIHVRYVLGLGPDSPALADMRTGVCKDDLLGVPAMAINGIWTPSVWEVLWPSAENPFAVFGVLWSGLAADWQLIFFPGLQNDLVVSETSQKGVVANTRDVPNTWHLAESTNSMVKSDVLDFLSMPLPRGAPWTTSGVPSAGQAEVDSPRQITVQNGTVTITSPAAGTVVSPGQLLHVSIQAPSGTRQVFVGMPNGRAVVAEHPPFEVDLAVPVESLGNVSIGALAWDGSTVLGLGTTDVRVVTTATVSSLAVLPSSVVYLGVGEFLPLRASATFSDGATRLVTSSEFGTTYESSKPTVASVTTEGVVAGLSPGYSVIKVRNGGQQVDVPVLVTPPDLPQLTLSLSGASFQMGDTLILTATVTPGATPRTVDVYLAVRLPDGTLLFYPSLTQDLQSVLTNWTVAPFAGEVFRYTFSGGEPAGGYAWLAAFTEPGTLTFVTPIVEAPFTFSP